MKKPNNSRRMFFTTLIMATCALVTSCANNTNIDIFYHPELKPDIVYDENYKLEQVLIISRHNIRSPITDADSKLGKLTPHEWFKWTSKPSELSVKGGLLETNMGQFFRKYLEKKGLIPENWIPTKDEIYFNSNAYQRTIATANFFATGMIPLGDITIDHNPLGTVDKKFCPILPDPITTEFENQVRAEIDALCGEGGFKNVGKTLKEAYTLLEKVLDFKDSEYAKEHNIEHIPLDDNEFTMIGGKEIGDGMTGGLKIANEAIDALKLQIYEEPNLKKALFGHTLTEKEIITMCTIGDMYQKVQEGSKTLAKYAMKAMAGKMKDELENDDRVFTFLCGHDSTIASLTTALDIKEYDLPGAISCKTPIGGKILFEKYTCTDDSKEYLRPYLCYNTTSQLRNNEITSLDNPPMFYSLEFNGLNKNAGGYYNYNDVIARLSELSSDEQFDYNNSFSLNNSYTYSL